MQHLNAMLPDPFLRADGTRVKQISEWSAQAEALRRLAQEHMYGTWPGKAETVVPEDIYRETIEVGAERGFHERLRLFVNNEFEVLVEIARPLAMGKVPVIVWNNCLAWGGLRCPVEEEVLKAGYAVAAFNREDIVPDWSRVKTAGEDVSRKAYAHLSCGDIMAWGWGHSLVADYLETCDWAGELICTGHSRGGKAALCAGVFDERFIVVAPMGSGCGGAGSARFIGTVDGSRQDSTRCETIGRMAANFPYWMNARYASYGSKEMPFPIGKEVDDFPIDAHMLRAACAPRAVFDSEGDEDAWCNLFGTQLCYEAAQKVYDFLGVPERNGFNVRKGGHAFSGSDWVALIDFCNLVLHRERTGQTNNLNQKLFAIDLKDYAPWGAER